MEQFSQSTCWTLTEDFGHLKGQEKFPRNQVRQKKEKKKRGIKKKKKTRTLVGNWRWEEGPTFRKTPSWWGNQLRQKGTFRRSKENSVDSLWKAVQIKNCTRSLCGSPETTWPELCVLYWRGGVGKWGFEHGSR